MNHSTYSKPIEYPLPLHSQDTPPSRLIADLQCRRTDAPPLILCLNRHAFSPEKIKQLSRHALTPEELSRSNGYRLATDSERFTIGRGILRIILGLWLGTPPHKVSLVINHYGKPFCAGAPQFNTSHSGDLIILAFHPCNPVGVDVEQVIPGFDWEPIDRHILKMRLTEVTHGLPSEQQELHFFRLWCRLEAELKAHGSGLNDWEARRQPIFKSQHWDLKLPEPYLGSLAMITAGTSQRRTR